MAKQHYKVTLTAKSPVFIGDGSTIGKSEYIFDKSGRQIIVFNRDKLLGGLQRLGYLRLYCDSVLQGKTNLMFFFEKNNIRPNVYNAWADYRMSVNASISPDKATKGILTFVKDAYGLPYIPGSSLKGALRTVILSDKVKNEDFSGSKREIMKNSDYRKKAINMLSQNVEKKAFYTLGRNEKKKGNATNDIFCGLSISDSEPVSTDDLILCVKTDVMLSGDEKTVGIVVRECLKPGTRLTFTLSVNPEQFPYSVEEIKTLISKRFADYRSTYLDKFKYADIDDVVGDNNIVLGGGAGFFSKTVAYDLLGYDDGLDFTKSYIFRNHKHEMDSVISPRTRKATEFDGKLYDMGICRIDFDKMV